MRVFFGLASFLVIVIIGIVIVIAEAINRRKSVSKSPGPAEQ
jgi:hypothetical protein